MPGMKVLAAPAQFFLSRSYGSENTWPLRLMQAGHRRFANEYTALCHHHDVTTPLQGIRIEAVGRPGGKTTASTGRFILRYGRTARRLLQQSRYDIVHHVLPWGYRETFNPLATSGDRRRPPFVVGPIQYPQAYSDAGDYELGLGLDAEAAARQEWFESLQTRFLGRLLRHLQKKTLQSAELVAFDSPGTRNLYLSTFGDLERDRVEVIPPGVETDIFAPRVPYPERPSEILTVAYFRRRKGLETLVLAFRRVLEDHPEVRLRVCGDGPSLPHAIRLAGQLGLGDKVAFQGRVSRNELPGFYSRARLFALPSLSEGFPSAVLEALASGTPVVASRVGALTSTFEGSVGVQLCNPGDPEDLAKTISKTLGRDGAPLSAWARQEAETRYSWDRIAAEWQDAYGRARALAGARR